MTGEKVIHQQRLCQESDASDAPTKLVVVARGMGAPSEVWIIRQLQGFAHLSPSVLTWRCAEGVVELLDPIPVKQLSFPPAPEDGPLRWWLRMRNAPSHNFYGCVGDERSEIETWLDKVRPDVLLCHYGHLALRLLPAARRLGIPIVAHFHGMDISSMLNNRWYRWSLRSCLSQFEALVVVGNQQRERLVGLGADSERVHLIPCGVPTDEFVLKPELHHATTRFICVSRLVECKGVHESISAFARVQAQLPDVELVIIGDGPQREELHRRARELGVESQVRFLGVQPISGVLKSLSEADVFVQHSLRGSNGAIEGFGVSVAEAASVGLPVVATLCGGIVDQVVDGRTGYLVGQGDIEAMSQRMVTLATNPTLRRTMGLAGRKRMQDHFDAAMQIGKLENVLIRSARTDERPRPALPVQSASTARW